MRLGTISIDSLEASTPLGLTSILMPLFFGASDFPFVDLVSFERGMSKLPVEKHLNSPLTKDRLNGSS